MKDSEVVTNEIEFDLMTQEEFRDIQTEIEAGLADVNAGRFDDVLATLGVSRDDAKTINSQDFVIRKGQQLTGLETALVLIAAGTGAKVGRKMILDVWAEIIFPRLKSRYGPRIRLRHKRN